MSVRPHCRSSRISLECEESRSGRKGDSFVASWELGFIVGRLVTRKLPELEGVVKQQDFNWKNCCQWTWSYTNGADFCWTKTYLIYSEQVLAANYRHSLSFQLTPWEALKAEFLFAVNISIVTKPVHNRLSESEGSPKSRSQKSRSRAGSMAQGSVKEKSDRSVNLNNESSAFSPRSLSGFSRIGKFFGKKISD